MLINYITNRLDIKNAAMFAKKADAENRNSKQGGSHLQNSSPATNSQQLTGVFCISMTLMGAVWGREEAKRRGSGGGGQIVMGRSFSSP